MFRVENKVLFVYCFFKQKKTKLTCFEGFPVQSHFNLKKKTLPMPENNFRTIYFTVHNLQFR